MSVHHQQTLAHQQTLGIDSSTDAGVLDRVGQLFLAALTIEVPSPDTDLLETGLLDSLALVELLVRLEQEFQISIAFETLEIEHFRSLASIADFVAASRISAAETEIAT